MPRPYRWVGVRGGCGSILKFRECGWASPQTCPIAVQLKALLEAFGITQFYTNDWGAYQRLLHPAFHTLGKANTQTIERKHLTLRTRIKRLARKTICFSKSIWLHDVVIGLFISRYEFGLSI
jgi:insertion element IS1 protein InsB